MKMFHGAQFLKGTIVLYLRMKNKRWTAKTEITESLLKFREKRKWQIALRRYLLEGGRSSFYAPYFGIDIAGFREWIEFQFDANINWNNFGEAWQIDHIVPLAYFDFDSEEDLKLCWNFLNIRVEKTGTKEKERNRVDIIGAKYYYQALYNMTEYIICKNMIQKIEAIEASEAGINEKQRNFLIENRNRLKHLCQFSSYEYDQLNTGINLDTVINERELLKKYGK